MVIANCRTIDAFALAHSLFEPDESCSAIRIQISRTDGTPIPGALANAGGHWQAIADNSGEIELTCAADLRLPVAVEVSADGYRTRSLLIRDRSRSTVRIELNALSRHPAIFSHTVNLRELSPAAQERSLQLQEEGLAAYRRADFGEAENLFREALVLTPSTPGLYNNLGVICAGRLELDLAADWFEKALALEPYAANVAGNLGIIRWLQNRTDESYRLLQMAFSRGYTHSPAHFVFGLLALQKGSTDEAVEHLSKADRKSFRYRDLYLSIAFQRARKPDAAAKNYRQFLKRNPAPLMTAVYSGAGTSREAGGATVASASK